MEHLVQPVRDVFAAIFFVAGVGMLITPAQIAEHWAALAVMTAVVIAGKIVSVAIGVFLTGEGTRMAVRAGMSLAQIGEFSFIIAWVGLSSGTTRPFLTGATVLAILRAHDEVLIPTGRETLQAGDLLAVAGTAAAIDSARQLLARTAASAGAPVLA